MHGLKILLFSVVVWAGVGCKGSSNTTNFLFVVDDLVTTTIDSSRSEIGFNTPSNPVNGIMEWMVDHFSSKNFTIIEKEAEMSDQSKMINDINKAIGDSHSSFEVVDIESKEVVVYFSATKISGEDADEETWLCSISIFKNPSKGFSSSLVDALNHTFPDK